MVPDRGPARHGGQAIPDLVPKDPTAARRLLRRPGRHRRRLRLLLALRLLRALRPRAALRTLGLGPTFAALGPGAQELPSLARVAGSAVTRLERVAPIAVRTLVTARNAAPRITSLLWQAKRVNRGADYLAFNGETPADPPVTARGRTLVFDSKNGIADISGDARVTRGEDEITGETIHYNVNERRIQAAGGSGGQVRIVIQPNNRAAPAAGTP